jgi:hypothetical protein
MHSTLPEVLHRTKMAGKRYAVQGLKRLNRRVINKPSGSGSMGYGRSGLGSQIPDLLMLQMQPESQQLRPNINECIRKVLP